MLHCARLGERPPGHKPFFFVPHPPPHRNSRHCTTFTKVMLKRLLIRSVTNRYLCLYVCFFFKRRWCSRKPLTDLVSLGALWNANNDIVRLCRNTPTRLNMRFAKKEKRHICTRGKNWYCFCSNYPHFSPPRFPFFFFECERVVSLKDIQVFKAFSLQKKIHVFFIV